MTRSVLPLALLLAAACSTAGAPVARPVDTATVVDTARLFAHVRVLADDSMQGRRTGTPGGERARRYVVEQFARVGLARFAGTYEVPFSWKGTRDTTTRHGANVVGWVRGRERPGRFIVVSAHYDHLGIAAPVNGDSLYNGADDNASGTAAVIELARWYVAHPPRTSMIFVAFDAEESGLQGARAFVAAPPVSLDSIVIDANMDMVSHNDRNELYVSGTYQYPYLAPWVTQAAAGAPVTLRTGHDTPADLGEDNWVMSSDHGPFHLAHIPFLYFGVEDHPDYHRPSDEWRTVTPVFFGHAVETVHRTIELLDANATAIRAQR